MFKFEDKHCKKTGCQNTSGKYGIPTVPALNVVVIFDILKTSGPSCSKLTTSLVNDSLKFTSSDTQIC